MPKENILGILNYPGKRSVIKNPPSQPSRLGRDKFKKTNPRRKAKVA